MEAKTRVILESFPGKENRITDIPDDEDSEKATGGGLKPSTSDIAAALHEADFDPPIYNVWKQQEKTKGSAHFGNSEVRWVDNLL